MEHVLELPKAMNRCASLPGERSDDLFERLYRDHVRMVRAIRTWSR